MISLLTAWLRMRAEQKRKKTKDDDQLAVLTDAMDASRKAKTIEEKIAANKKLSESFRAK